jgi:hypothetical protein
VASHLCPGNKSTIQVIRDLKKAKQVTFSLAFVTKPEQIDALAPKLALKVEGDAIVWFAYQGRGPVDSCERNVAKNESR